MPESTDVTLRRLYARVLGIDETSDGDTLTERGFFELGGSSQHVVRLLETVHERLGVTVELESFFREPSLAGLRRAVSRQRADLVSLLVDAAFAGPLERPAVAGHDGELSYGELLEMVSAAADNADPAAEPAARRVDTSVAGARDVLTGLAARRPTLLLDPGSTAAELDTAWRMFNSANQPPAVHAVSTSGSTGRPKVVVSPNDGAFVVQRAHAEAYGLGPTDTYLVMAPLHWGYGFKAGMLVGLLAGATVVLAPQPLRADSLRRLAAERRITMTMGSSMAYRVLLAADAELPALRHAMVGGDPLPADVTAAWRQRTGVSLTDSYGCSESDHICDNLDHEPGSVGRPLPCVELRVRRDDGTFADTGEGELLVRSPGLAHGYAGDPDRTAERFADGWYATGDRAELRADGHVLLRGRLDDQLNIAGAKVDPREVEQACRDTLGLRDCVVVASTGVTGVPQLRAYVVAEEPITQDRLSEAISGRLSAHKIPAQVVQLDALPRSAAGKVLTRELP